MDRVELTLERTLPVWWAFVWRALVVSMFVGFVLGAVGGFIAGITGHATLAALVGGVLGWLGGIPVSIWALKVALTRSYDGCEFVLVKR